MVEQEMPCSSAVKYRRDSKADELDTGLSITHTPPHTSESHTEPPSKGLILGDLTRWQAFFGGTAAKHHPGTGLD
jgi:hypothetical protein